MLDHALWLASQGFAVFPLRPRDKRPATSDGFKSATRDPEQIRAWWSACPDYNVGIATGAASGCFVVDVDGPIGEQSLAALGPMPETAEARTGKGRHLFFKYPGPSGSGAGKIGQHVDHRSDGGYVVAAPSIHPNGHRYEWTRICTLADLPASVLARLSAPKTAPAPSVAPPAAAAPVLAAPAPMADVDSVKVSRSLDEWLSALEFAAPGTKHETLVNASTAHACAAHERGEPREQAQPRVVNLLCAALALNRGSRVDNWDQAQATIASAFEKAYARVGVLMAHEREFSEDGLARRFAKLYGLQGSGAVVFVPERGWYAWDGRRWAAQAGNGTPTELVSAMLTSMQQELEARGVSGDASAGKLADAIKSKKTAGSMGAILRLAQRYAFAPFAALDRDPYLLTVQNGTIDLRTGQLRPHAPADLITRACAVAYDPGALAAGGATRWLTALLQMQGGDYSAIEYMRVLFGSFLYGASIDGFWIMHGNGFDGKTTVLEVLSGVLGDYAGAASPRSILVQRNAGQQHTSAMGSLVGKRLVCIDELPAESQLDTGAIKAAFGRMPVQVQTAMGKDFVSAVPTAKGLVATNHLPRIDEHDGGTRRRFAMIPFDADLRAMGVRKDDTFALRLVAQEGPAILAWLVSGFMSWAGGTGPSGAPERAPYELPFCERVRAATEELFGEGDLVGAFLSTCEFGPEFECVVADLYNAYKRYAEEQGDYSISKRAFGNRMREKGIRPARKDNARLYKGVRPPASLAGKPPAFGQGAK